MIPVEGMFKPGVKLIPGMLIPGNFAPGTLNPGKLRFGKPNPGPDLKPKRPKSNPASIGNKGPA